MSHTFLGDPELGYERHVYLAVELLDGVTMTRIREGVTVVAEGLQGKPIINGSGFFVWLEEENSVAQKITVDPDELPYEKAELSPLTFPLSRIQLQPKVGYSFTPGITGLRGTLIERQITPVAPIGDAEVQLAWLDDSDTWRDATTMSRTNSGRGDFVSILRLAPTDKPKVDANGAVTVRLHARRGVLSRSSTDFKLPQGRVTDPSTSNPLTFAWDDLQP
jgi:hypothetical protein